MTTLNQIKTLLKNWFLSHRQVRHFYWGDLYNYTAINDKDFVSVNVEFVDSSLNGKMMDHSFRISIGDRVDDNVEGHEDEVISDAVSIANDFFTFLEENEDFTFVMNINVQPFTDDTGDRLSGVVFRVILSVPRMANECHLVEQ